MADRDRQNRTDEQSRSGNQNQTQASTQMARRREQLPSSRASSMAWLAGSPFDLMRRFNEEMQGWLGHAATWEPDVEVFQRGSDLVVRADLPGLNPDDVTVEIADDAITLRGERREEHVEEHDGFFRTERVYGTFYRVIPLPEGAIAETAKATFNNGVLEIVVQVPPSEVSRGRKLQIESSSNQRQGQGQQRNQESRQQQSGQQQTGQQARGQQQQSAQAQGQGHGQGQGQGQGQQRSQQEQGTQSPR